MSPPRPSREGRRPPPDRRARLAALAERLGLAAAGPHLDAALTHPSFVNEHAPAGPHYERLEFLGDAAVGLWAAERLAAHFPDADEGELSRRRAAMVCRQALACLARDLDLGACLRTGRGEPAEPSARVLAAALEAVVGALYLAGGMPAVARGLAPLIDGRRVAAPLGPPVDAKTALQERCHVLGHPPPTYRLVATSGPAHARAFAVEVTVGEALSARARAGRKRAAEQAAAQAALDALAGADPRAPGESAQDRAHPPSAAARVPAPGGAA